MVLCMQLCGKGKLQKHSCAAAIPNAIKFYYFGTLNLAAQKICTKTHVNRIKIMNDDDAQLVGICSAIYPPADSRKLFVCKIMNRSLWTDSFLSFHSSLNEWSSTRLCSFTFYHPTDQIPDYCYPPVIVMH